MEHLSLDVLRSFIAITELEGFNRAAEKVSRSESAISMQMRRLEELTGQALFEKKGKRHLLTHQGEILLGYARKMLDLNDEALLALKRSRLKGRVRLGMQQDFSGSLLTEVLVKFGRSFPEILLDITVDTSDALQQQLIKGKQDIVLYLAKEKNASLESISLGSFALKWIYSQGHAALLKDRPLSLVLLGPACKMRQTATRALDQAAIPWKGPFTSSHLSAVWAAIDAGLGISARTTIGLPSSLKPVPASAGLPKLPSVHAFLCTRQSGGTPPVLRLKEVLATSHGVLRDRP